MDKLELYIVLGYPVALGLFLWGGVLAWRGAAGFPARGKPRCGRCSHAVVESDGLTCAKCGVVAKKKRWMRAPKRSFRGWLAGCGIMGVAVFAGLIGAMIESFRRDDWMSVSEDEVIGAMLRNAGIALLASAVMLIVSGWYGDRSRGRRRCPKCWYAMHDLEGMRCPECGRTPRAEKRFFRPRRKWKRISAGMLALGIGFGAWWGQRWQEHGMLGLVPTTYLIWQMETVPEEWVHDPQTDETWTLEARLLSDDLWDWQERWVIERVGDRLIDSGVTQTFLESMMVRAVMRAMLESTQQSDDWRWEDEDPWWTGHEANLASARKRLGDAVDGLFARFPDSFAPGMVFFVASADMSDAEVVRMLSHENLHVGVAATYIINQRPFSPEEHIDEIVDVLHAVVAHGTGQEDERAFVRAIAEMLAWRETETSSPEHAMWMDVLEGPHEWAAAAVLRAFVIHLDPDSTRFDPVLNRLLRDSRAEVQHTAIRAAGYLARRRDWRLEEDSDQPRFDHQRPLLQTFESGVVDDDQAMAAFRVALVSVDERLAEQSVRRLAEHSNWKARKLALEVLEETYLTYACEDLVRALSVDPDSRVAELARLTAQYHDIDLETDPEDGATSNPGD